jgi:hypothetical protein
MLSYERRAIRAGPDISGETGRCRLTFHEIKAHPGIPLDTCFAALDDIHSFPVREDRWDGPCDSVIQVVVERRVGQDTELAEMPQSHSRHGCGLVKNFLVSDGGIFRLGWACIKHAKEE